MVWLFCWTVWATGCANDWLQELLNSWFVFVFEESVWAWVGVKAKGRNVWLLCVWALWAGLGWLKGELNWVNGWKAIGTNVRGCEDCAGAVICCNGCNGCKGGNGLAVGVKVVKGVKVCGLDSWVWGWGWVVGKDGLSFEGKVSIGIDWFLLRRIIEDEEGLSRICRGSSLKGGRSNKNGFPPPLDAGWDTWPQLKPRKRHQTMIWNIRLQIGKDKR